MNAVRLRPLAWQAAAVLLVVSLVALVGWQARQNLAARGVASGFAYLGRAAGFEIAPGVVGYSSRDTYASALLVGVVNTLRVSLLAILLATGLGTVMGLMRLSPRRPVAAVAAAAIEVLRNTPLLVQLLGWYVVWAALPPPRAALAPLPGVLLCNRGLYLPGPSGPPALSGFDVRGGLSVTPEFAALVLGLSTCTAAFVAEIVRGGILAVGRGQSEAAASLGLSRLQALRHVVVPQALPVMLPPAAGQFVNVVKGSALGVAIGYPDLMAITSTTLNQTGQAIEAIAVAMACYLGIGLALSIAVRALPGGRT